MPRPAQVSIDGIISTARNLLEQDGYEALTLARIAQALGIKAPSLYKHVADKTDLIRLVNLETYRDLTAAMHNVPPSNSYTQLADIASSYRRFALDHPTLYMLAMSEAQPDPTLLEALAIPFQDVFAQIVAEGEALNALRGFWALVHGFVVLEISERFRRAGSLEGAFHAAVQAYLRGWGIQEHS